jgi:ATP-dependent helicase/DNAse subunit B
MCGGFACFALLMVLPAVPTAAQLDSPAANAAVQRNLQAARVERLRKAMSDANTLEFLAAQLKTEIAKSRPDTVSVTVTKRAEEIEKLARKIRTESEQYRYF